jgi:hypothetical protein
VKKAAFATLLIGAVIVLGCGKSSENQETPQTVHRETQSDRERTMPTRIYKARVYSSGVDALPQSVRDSLRTHKKRLNITRDEQWPGQGGVLANEYFEVWYTEGPATITHAMRVMNDMTNARARFIDIFGQAPGDPLILVLPPDLDAYAAWTGREFWHYSNLRSDTMTVQPIHLLIKRGIARYAIPHEYFQWAVGRITGFGAPRWLEEGIGSYFAHEGDLLEDLIAEFPKEAYNPTLEQLENALLGEISRQDSRIAYRTSNRMVAGLVEQFGEDKLVDLVLRLAEGFTMDEACQDVYAMNYKGVLDLLDVRTEDT